VTLLIVLVVLALLLYAIELLGRAPPAPTKVGTPTSAV